MTSRKVRGREGGLYSCDTMYECLSKTGNFVRQRGRGGSENLHIWVTLLMNDTLDLFTLSVTKTFFVPLLSILNHSETIG